MKKSESCTQSSMSNICSCFGDNSIDEEKIKYMFEFFTDRTNKLEADKDTKITRIQRRMLSGEEKCNLVRDCKNWENPF